MTDNTENLIATLANTMEPVTRAAPPLVLFLKWFCCALIYLALLTFIWPPRPDIALKLHSPLYLAEVVALIMVMISSGLSATALSFPDLHQKRWLVFAPVIPILLFVTVLAIEWLADNPPAPAPVHSFECLQCIILLTILPAAGMLYMLRKQASIHYYLAGGIALIAASSVGCLTLRIAENTDCIYHLITWHYLPMIGFGIIGIWLGRKFLKW